MKKIWKGDRCLKLGIEKKIQLMQKSILIKRKKEKKVEKRKERKQRMTSSIEQQKVTSISSI
jgi:hypothetical protein